MTRPSTSLALAFALALGPACKNDAPAAPTPGTPAAPGTPATPGAPATPSKAGTPPTAGTPATPATPPMAAAAPSTPAAALDPLLDLVGADADTFVVVRAPNDFIDGFAGIALGGKDMWSRILDAVRDPAEPDADAGMRKLLVEFDTVQTALAASGLHLERGVTISGKAKGESIVVLAADDAESMPKLMRTLSAKPDEVKLTCKAVAEAPGFVACSDDAAVLAAWAPGKQAAKHRGTLVAGLGDQAPGASNVLASFIDDKGPVLLAVRTNDGVLQLDVRPPGIEEFLEVDGPGPAAALAVVQPGGSFGWMRLDVPAIAAKAAAGAPGMVKTMLGALSGEILMSGIGATPGLVTLIGLTDATPIQGLIPMAALAKDQIPKQLPDGSKLEVVIEDADDGSGGKVQVLRAKLEPSAELAKLRDQLGLQPEVTVFVTKQWAAVGVGTGTAVIPDVAKASGGEPSAALLAALPAGLSGDLRDGRASMAMHLELDGLHAPGVREQLQTAIGSTVAADAKLTPADAIGAAFAAIAPLSSMSLWTTSTADGAVFHFALRGFGDAVTDEGRAAQQARFDVMTGKRDAASAYGALVAAYPSSPRIEAYRGRAGTVSGTGGPGAVAAVGVLAAVAIPAFKTYIDRSKEAAKSVAAVPPTGK